ncbi:MAG: hypothetical protein Q9170_004396 [Blastenia crenularia]
MSSTPPEFISRTEILRYRTITTLLSYTNAAAGRFDERLIYSSHNFWVSDRKRERHKRLGHFVSLLVRENEEVASWTWGNQRCFHPEVTLFRELPFGKGDKGKDEDANQCKEGVLEGQSGYGEQPPKLSLELLTGSPVVLEEDEPALRIFLRCQSLSFQDHCTVVLQLLKNNKAAPTVKQRLSTMRDFEAWIFLTSCKRMRKSFNSGQNMWHHLVEVDEQQMESENPAFEHLLQFSLDDEFRTGKHATAVRKLIDCGALDEGAEKTPFFDTKGRNRFRQILSQTLYLAQEAVNELCDALDSIEVKSYNQSSQCAKDRILRNVAQTVVKALESFEVLWCLRKDCSQKLYATLKWIALIFKLRDTMSNTSKHWGVERVAEPDWVSDWADAAYQYINSICSPMEGIHSLLSSNLPSTKEDRSLMKEEKAYCSFVKRASVRVINVKPERRDVDMQPFHDCLKDRLPDEKQVSEAKSWLQGLDATPKDEDWDQARFKGTMHCEAILLSLHALSLSSTCFDKDVPSTTALRTSLLPIASIPAEVIEALRIGKFPHKILSASKVCCPSCTQLAELIREDGARQPMALGWQQLTYPKRQAWPGRLDIWFPTTLPPWLPRRFAMKLLVYAEEILRDRLRGVLQEQGNARKRSASSGAEPGDGSPSKRSKRDWVAEVNEHEEDRERYV